MKPEEIGEVIDGYAPGWHPVEPSEDVIQLQAFIRFQHQIILEINKLTSDWSTPDVMDLIQIKTRTALRFAEKSELLK
jgi:hypothetical protein